MKTKSEAPNFRRAVTCSSCANLVFKQVKAAGFKPVCFKFVAAAKGVVSSFLDMEHWVCDGYEAAEAEETEEA